MKFRFFLLAFFVVSFQNVFAAFPVKTNIAINETIRQHAVVCKPSYKLYSGKEDNGIFGILSIGCMLLSIVSLYLYFLAGYNYLLSALFALSAVVFGVIGKQEGRHLQWLAKIGFIWGALTVISFVIFLAVFLAM